MTRAAFLAVLLASAAAAAQHKTPEELARIRQRIREDTAAWGRPAWSLTPKVGVGLGDLDLGPQVGLDLSYAPPILGRQLLIGVDAQLQYTSVRGAGFDVGVSQLAPMLLASFHPYPESWPIAPFGGIGGGLCAMRTKSTFEQGGATRAESELRLAAALFGGIQIRAGRASFEAEVRYVRSSSATRVLKDSSVLPVQMTMGYRLPL